MLVLDYEKARELVISALEGKVSTVTATRVVLALKEATIEATPVVHGRWKQRGKKLGECSECGEVVLVRYRCCPNCGARMDGDGDD